LSWVLGPFVHGRLQNLKTSEDTFGHDITPLRDFTLADHTLPTRPDPAWQKMAQSLLNDATQPVDIEEKGRSPTTDRRWLKEKVHTN